MRRRAQSRTRRTHAAADDSVRGCAALRRRTRCHSRLAGGLAFLTLEDQSGLAEVVVFPDIYARDAAQLAAGGVLRIVGVVDERFGSCTLQAERIE